MLIRAAIYLRSAYTQDQVQNCLVQLQDTVAARGWTVVTVQVDRFIGVAKGRNRLPGWLRSSVLLAGTRLMPSLSSPYTTSASRLIACWRPWLYFIGMA